MKAIIFDADAYEDQLAYFMLEALEKQGIISIASKSSLTKEIGEEASSWDEAIS